MQSRKQSTLSSFVLGDPVEAVGTDVAAAEEETCGETRTLGGPVEAAGTDAAAAEEETCGKTRTLGGSVEPTAKTGFETVGEAADTDTSAAENAEARALGDPVEAADTDAAAAEEETCP